MFTCPWTVKGIWSSRSLNPSHFLIGYPSPITKRAHSSGVAKVSRRWLQLALLPKLTHTPSLPNQPSQSLRFIYIYIYILLLTRCSPPACRMIMMITAHHAAVTASWSAAMAAHARSTSTASTQLSAKMTCPSNGSATCAAPAAALRQRSIIPVPLLCSSRSSTPRTRALSACRPVSASTLKVCAPALTASMKRSWRWPSPREGERTMNNPLTSTGFATPKAIQPSATAAARVAATFALSSLAASAPSFGIWIASILPWPNPLLSGTGSARSMSRSSWQKFRVSWPRLIACANRSSFPPLFVLLSVAASSTMATSKSISRRPRISVAGATSRHTVGLCDCPRGALSWTFCLGERPPDLLFFPFFLFLRACELTFLLFQCPWEPHAKGDRDTN